MANMITSDCILCGVCVPECPHHAISKGKKLFVIDPALCTECEDNGGSPACMEVCPVDDAIVPA